MSQGMRFLLAAASAAMLLPDVHAADNDTQISCRTWIVRVSDQCYERLKAAMGSNCCQDRCGQSPATSASSECCSRNCPEAKCCHRRCEASACCPAAVPAAFQLPLTLNEMQTRRMFQIIESDESCEVLSAPRVTTLPGQTANVCIESEHFFVTRIQPATVNGQTVFFPVNEPMMGGCRMQMLPAFMPDGKSMILDLDLQVTDLDPNVPPLFPVTTTISPVFEGGAQGQPIPFTQFIQQLSLTTRGVRRIVGCTEGQTVVLDCGRRTTVNERVCEVPVLCDLPIIGEWFRSRRTEVVSDRLLVFVTPNCVADTSGEESATGAVLPPAVAPVMCEPAEVLPMPYPVTVAAPRQVPAMPCAAPCPAPRPRCAEARLAHPAAICPPPALAPPMCRPACPVDAATPIQAAQFACVPAVPAIAVSPPMHGAITQVGASEPACSLRLVNFLIEYHEACRAGDRVRARNLAAQCIALDPTCFSR